MWAIECIPLTLTGAHLELTYFSRTQIKEGSVISIPLRKKEVFGLVLSCTPLKERKQDLRSRKFELKKLKDQKPKLLFSRAFLRGAFEASMYLAQPPGDVIASLSPLHILKSKASIPDFIEKDTPGGFPNEMLQFTQTHEERLSEYKRLAREALARGSSLMIIAPTIAEANHIGESLEHNMQGYIEIIHSGISKKKLITSWTRALSGEKPLVVVGTLQALSIPRSDYSAIIFEREGSRAYVHEVRPYTHGKTIAESIARAYGTRFITASTTPSIDALYKRQNGDTGDLGISLTRLVGPTPQLFDLKTHTKTKSGYDPLMAQSIARIDTALKESKQVLVIAARRGLAPQTVCDDCGSILTCAHCGTTLVLHARGGPHYLCHHCGKEEAASVRCRRCESWRLTPLGIALDAVAISLSKHFKDAPLFIIGQEESGKENKLVSAWNEKGGILVSTERALPYLTDEVPLIVIASIDSFLGIPEYSAAERAFILLCELKSRAKESLYIQTRDPLHRVLKSILEGSGNTYYKEELSDRERYLYPPYRVLVRITVSGKKEIVDKQTKELLKALESFAPLRIDARANKKATARVHVLIRLKADAWIDHRLLRFLRSLPASLEVRINPLSVHTD